MTKKEEKWERIFNLICHSSRPKSPSCSSILFSFKSTGLEGEKKVRKTNTFPGENEIWIVIHTTEHTYQLVEVWNDDYLCSHQRAFTHLHFEFDTDEQCQGEYACIRLLHGQSSSFSWLIGWLTTEICFLPLKRFSAMWLPVRKGFFFFF